MAKESLEGIVSSIDKTSSLDILEENALTKREVKRLYNYAKKYEKSKNYEKKEKNWQELKTFVSKKFNYFEDFPDEQVEILTFLLQYSLLKLTSKPMRKLGRHKRRTGRLTPAHSIDAGLFLVEGFRRLFGDYVKSEDEEYSSIVIKALTTKRKLNYKHIAGALLHDIVEDTYGAGEGEITLEKLAYDLSMFIIESDKVKDKKRYVQEAKDITHIVDYLTHYIPTNKNKSEKRFNKVFGIIEEAKSAESKKVFDKQEYDKRFETLMREEPVEMRKLNYYRFTRRMTEPSLDDMLTILQIKGADVVSNILETIMLKKELRHSLYLNARDIFFKKFGKLEDSKWIERISRGRYKSIKKGARILDNFVEKAGKNPLIARMSYWAERDRALTGVQKLVTYFKSSRIVPVFNQYMNEYGFDPDLHSMKRLNLEATGERIIGREREILKYECTGFDRTYLDDKPENPFEDIDGLVYENGKTKIEKGSWLWKEVIKGGRLASLGFGFEEILENPEIILDYKVLESLYRKKLNKDKKAEFDVLDKIVLDKKFENYRKSGNLFRRTKEQRDPIESPFNVLEANYDKVVEGDKEAMEEIRDDMRKQYIHLLVFGGLNKGYLDDMYKDKKHKIPKLNIDENGKMIKGINYKTFDWGKTG